MTRDRARAVRGTRVVDRVPRNRGTVTTMLGALGADGMRALMTYEGATTGEIFALFVQEALVPTLRPGNVVVMDQLGAHKIKRVREMIEAAGARLLFLPPYHPDLNPIENAWSKVKTALRRIAARTRDRLEEAIFSVCWDLTARDAAGWFQHCGYQLE